ncbi:MAG: protoheme IX farnesyltransferase [Armatimonadetes bacterium]|nr:protoheme IX farnesyltransferase [Armatimonadota bacterium]
MSATSTRIARIALAFLAYTVLVILWGAFVRASFSGDGCGTHWPTCGGEILPVGKEAKTYIEFSHRVSSALFGLIGLGLGIWAIFNRKRFPGLVSVALGMGFFTFTESMLGRALVLKGHVAADHRNERGFWMGLHLVNTFFLILTVAWYAWIVTGRPRLRWRGQGPVLGALGFAAVGMLFLGVTGAIAALGDMLSPSATVIEGLRKDVDPTSHLFVRLRALHPFIATSIGVFLIFLVSYLNRVRPSEEVRRGGKLVLGLFIGQMAFGFLNLLMQAPIPMQIGHLLLADLIWIAFLYLTAGALQEHAVQVPFEDAIETRRTEPTSTPVGVAEVAPQPIWKAYVALTKPRVVSLLLFTTITAAFVAAKGWPGGWVLLALTVGGYASAGAANAINMVYDRDIDVRMARTSRRPTVTAVISSRSALLFAFALEALSFGLLWQVCNLLTALLALAGLLFYVFVYTMGLKRRTWHNIVIGGAAGAFPPLVGYAGVTGDLTPMAWVLFAIIFVWTPVHFWALALLIQDDYRDAGVPMLPVVRGEKATVVQISLYSVLTVVVSSLPLLMGQAGFLYLVTALLLNAWLFVRTVQLAQTTNKIQARALFKFSMAYLAVLFLMIAVDQAVKI